MAKPSLLGESILSTWASLGGEDTRALGKEREEKKTNIGEKWGNIEN